MVCLNNHFEFKVIQCMLRAFHALSLIVANISESILLFFLSGSLGLSGGKRYQKIVSLYLSHKILLSKILFVLYTSVISPQFLVKL